jgi:sugar lactone lactonase YvrE
MKTLMVLVLTIFLGACATVQDRRGATVSILVDLDPASVDRTVIVESITADKEGRLYLPDRVSGNILRVDPKSPKPVVVGRIEGREIKSKKVRADASGAAFNQQGDFFIAVGPFSEVVRIRGADLNPGKPGVAQTFATGTPGANGIAFDRQGNLYVSGGASGIVYRVGPNGGAAEPAVKIEGHKRTLPDGKAVQAIVANGLIFDAKNTLYVADTSRGAIWKVEIGADGKAGKPLSWVESPLLHGADGLAFDGAGRLWVTANERNALVTVAPDGTVREVAKNGSTGPLEFPSAIVFVGNTAYVSNFDTPRRDNMDANGETARDGIGASIAQITP